jgi:hypothetical protein
MFGCNTEFEIGNLNKKEVDNINFDVLENFNIKPSNFKRLFVGGWHNFLILRC